MANTAEGVRADRHIRMGRLTCLSRCVQSKHQQTHLLVGEQFGYALVSDAPAVRYNGNLPIALEMLAPIVEI